jgi:leucyl aminopeptidase
MTAFKTLSVRILSFVLLLTLSACSFPYQSIGPFGLQQPVADDLFQRTRPEAWFDWIEKLSGAEPVILDGESVLITSRASTAMFTGLENAQAFDYVHQQVLTWVPPSQVEVDEFTAPNGVETWRNLIVTLPGITKPDEVVLLTGHLDSTAIKDSDILQLAPGADDNGTGTATLLEAVRLLRDYRFERTLRIIFFTGEEDGLVGSQAYLEDHSTEGMQGVLNLDMFGYDGDGDRCFELHVGTLPGSDAIAQEFIRSIDRYQINLNYDYLTGEATNRSDHASFWNKGIPAILVIENLFENNLTGGCQGLDFTPNYHSGSDTADTINVGYGFDIARAALVTIAEMARPLPHLFPVQ